MCDYSLLQVDERLPLLRNAAFLVEVVKETLGVRDEHPSHPPAPSPIGVALWLAAQQRLRQETRVEIPVDSHWQRGGFCGHGAPNPSRARAAQSSIIKP